jgi:hypothetical protein
MEEQQPHRVLSRGRERTIKIFMALVTVLVTLGLAEVVVRVMMPREIMRYFFVTPDSLLHHRFLPGATGRYQSTEFNTHYTISSQGLRDREFQAPKPAGTFRILMLGDSFTEGDGVEPEDTFSKQLERTLDTVSALPHVEVINGGVGSYSPLLEYLYLKHGGLDLQPDLVVLNFDLSDMFDDINYSTLAVLDSSGTPVAVPGTGPTARRSWGMQLLVGWKDFIKNNLRLYNVIRIRIGRYLEAVRHEGVVSGDIRYDKYAMFRPSQGDGSDDREWTRSYAYLEMIHNLLRSRGIGFWVNVYPYAVQVSPKEWSTGRAFWGFRPDTVYSVAPQARIEQYCREHGIATLNMCEAFRKASASEFPLYWSDNGHWKPEGHAVVARTFAPAMVALLRSGTQPGGIIDASHRSSKGPGPKSAGQLTPRGQRQ